MKRKEERGFTTVDLSIAMIVVTIFVAIMGSVFYNVYLSSTEAKRTATALNYGVDIFEAIGDESLMFSSLTPYEVLTRLSDNLKIEEIKKIENDNEKIATGRIGEKGAYNIKLTMTEPVTVDEVKPIKQFKLIITYDVAAKKEPERVELERIRTITNKLKTDEEGVW